MWYVATQSGAGQQGEGPGEAPGGAAQGETAMTYNLESAEQMVVHLIAAANRSHREASWSYELTSEVENIEVVSR